MLKTFVICFVLTEIIELLLAYLLKVRQKDDLMYIFWVNVATNPPAVFVSNLLFYIGMNEILVYLIVEGCVILIEAILFKKYFDKPKGYLLALLLNVTSTLGGIIWSTMF